MQKILIADSKKHSRDILRIGLAGKDYELLEAFDGEEVLSRVAETKPNLVLLDIDIPVINGLKVCQQLRESSDIPIVLMIGKNASEDGIRGLELGADAYVTKPLYLREVLAKIKSVLRRAEGVVLNRTKDKLKLENLEIDMEKQTVCAFGRELKLTSRERELLWLLASHPGKAFSRVELLELLWGPKYYGVNRTVDTHIKSLRQKINAPLDANWRIITIWSIGYKFEIDTL